jgi:hypothetical protein
VLQPVTFLVDVSTARSGGRCSRLAATGSWLGGNEQRRAVKSRAGVRRLDAMNRGERGVSEKEKEALLTCSTAARIRVLRRAHVGQWSPAVYGDRRVAVRGVVRVRASDRCGRLSGGCD